MSDAVAETVTADPETLEPVTGEVTEIDGAKVSATGTGVVGVVGVVTTEPLDLL